MAARRSGSSRPELNRSAWQKLRKAARLRDGNRCVRCRSTKGLAAHHIVKPQHGGRDVLENLVTLCSRCHGLQHRGARRSENESLRPISRFSRKKLVEAAGPWSRAW
jgi:5-methylcytosine-specific restriction endonuclease McrA